MCLWVGVSVRLCAVNFMAVMSLCQFIWFYRCVVVAYESLI